MVLYNQSGVTELLTMGVPHYGRVCLSPRSSTFLAEEKASAFAHNPGGVAFIYHVTWDYLLPVSSHVLQFLMSKMGYFLIEIKVIKTIK